MENNEKTVITNENIRHLVYTYIHNPVNLPVDLRGKRIGDWVVSEVTNMAGLFMNYRHFNEPLDDWDVHNVETMENMFDGCDNFNQPLSSWIVSKVKNMRCMFRDCYQFNSELNWGDNVMNVENMKEMFGGCINFNQPLNWEHLENVINMSKMFMNCHRFNQPLNNWNVNNVTDMSDMFLKCTSFNGELWQNDLENPQNRLKNTAAMFCECSSFNQPLNWNVSNVEDMTLMFAGCHNFNQPLNSWNTSSVMQMSQMFYDCSRFNQPLDQWNVSNVEDMTLMFYRCTNFNQNLTNWVIPRHDSVSMFGESGMSEENKPLNMRGEDEDEDENEIDVDPNHVHRFAAKILYERLTDFFKTKLRELQVPNPEEYFHYVRETLNEIIDKSSEHDKKDGYKDNLNQIFEDKLNAVDPNSISQVIREATFYALEYVKNQPPDYINLYLKTFFEECMDAYPGDMQPMSCVGGIFERLLLKLELLYTSNLDNKDYETISDLINRNPEKLIPIYIQDWYKLHSRREDHPEYNAHEASVFNAMSKQDKKRNLKQYLIQIFGEENNNLIEQKINEIENAIGFDDDSFTYGGSKKRNRTNKKRKAKNKKTKKVRDKKMRKLHKKSKKNGGGTKKPNNKKTKKNAQKK